MSTKLTALLMLVQAHCPIQAHDPPEIVILPDNFYEFVMQRAEAPDRAHAVASFGWTARKWNGDIVVYLRQSTANERILCHELLHATMLQHQHFPGARRRMK